MLGNKKKRTLAYRIRENQLEIKTLGAQIDIYGVKKLDQKILGKIQNLQDKLSYRLQGLEVEGQQAKIKSLKAVLAEINT